MEFNTFSIVGRCERTGQLGVAVSTAAPAVGAYCPFARAGVGAVSSQSWCNPYLAYDGLDLMAEGMSAQEVCDKLLAEDPGRETRQIGYVDAKGGSAAFTGNECAKWNGHITGPNFAAQANLMMGGGCVTAMAETFDKAEMLDLAERLIAALEAGQAAGADARGKQSASVLVVHTECYPLVDLRADEHRQAAGPAVHRPDADPRQSARRLRRRHAPQHEHRAGDSPGRRWGQGGLTAERS